MINRISKFFRKSYQTLNTIEVSKQNILSNYRYLSSLDKKVNPSAMLRVDGEQSRTIKIAPVIKSNGYGHGIVNIAKILDKKKASFFCVDSLFEAYELFNAKIKTPVLITGYTNPENLKVKKLPFSYAVFTLDLAKTINDYQPQAGVHIFVDTGMHREGVSISELPGFLKEIEKLPNLKIEGFMSHLASSENKFDPLFLNQIKQYKIAKEICKKAGIKPKWFHIAATGSIINPETRSIIAGVSNMARAGLAMYGFSSSTSDRNLLPALTLKTKIVQIKKILKGEKIGYDGTFEAQKDLTVAVLGIGYYDGVDRRLSNKGVFLVSGIECPILGRVSMNVNIIDISHVPDPKIGEDVVVYSNNPDEKNSIANSAKICKTIPYELLVNLAESTKRIII